MSNKTHCRCASVLFLLLGLPYIAIGVGMILPFVRTFRSNLVSDGSSIEGALLAVLCAIGLVMLYLGYVDCRIAASHYRMSKGLLQPERMREIVGVMVIQFPLGTACGAYALFVQQRMRKRAQKEAKESALVRVNTQS